MTISTTTSRISYNGNGVTTIFAVPFRFFANTDLVVQLVTVSTGASTTLILGTHYTVTGADDEDGGSLTMVTAPAVGQRLVIRRVIAATQEVDYVAGDPFPAETHERALDRLTMLAQQGGEVNARALVFPAGDTASGELPAVASRANRLIGFDAAGNLVTSAPASGSAAELALNLAGTGGAGMVGTTTGATVQSAVGIVAASMSVASIASALATARAAGGGTVSFPAFGAMSGAVPVEVIGEFTNGLVVDGKKSTITGTSTAQDGMLVGNKVGEIAASYFNKFAIRDISTIGPGTTGTAAGIRQQAAADIVIENLRTRNWPIGLLYHGGLTSDCINLSSTYNNIGVEGRYFDDGIPDSTPPGLNTFSPNANTFYGARLFFNRQAVKYDNNPSGCVNWIGCNFEANNAGGNATDGVRIIEMTEAGHHNFFGTHHESSAGQYSMYYAGADDSKTLLLAGVENIDATGTNVHIQRGRLSSIGSRLTNTSSTHDIFLNTGARATLIDTEGAVTGDVSAVVSIRDGRVGFGVQPVVGNPVIDMQSAPIAASSNIAQNWRNDTVQLRFQNTAGTRVGYIQTSAASNHTIWNDNTLGGWTFGAGNAARMYIGRGGAANIEPGSDNTTTCGSASIRWSETFTRTIRPGTGGPIWTSGSGTPEGVVTAPVGSMFTRTDGGAGTTLYVKESGAGNTGWVAK